MSSTFLRAAAKAAEAVDVAIKSSDVMTPADLADAATVALAAAPGVKAEEGIHNGAENSMSVVALSPMNADRMETVRNKNTVQI